ncbi:hypothetical protein [Phenylobacterium sp.]|jgi:hypothetical protein|uniref:hypothetical protein n=1 Tax=Phenylobacterium sp. TaxID=1871053 RepID=UPI002EDAE5B3
MRPVLIALGLAALATPSLALTVSPAPNRDQQQHLRPAPAQQGLDIRDSYLGGGGGPTGLSYGQGARTNTDAPRFYYNSRDAWGRFNGVIPADDRFDTPRDRQTGYDPSQIQRRR